MARDEHSLAHCQRLGRGRTQHLRGRWVDEDTVAAKLLSRMVRSRVHNHWKPARVHCVANLLRVTARPIGVHGRQRAIYAGHCLAKLVEQAAVAFGPDGLRQEVRALVKASLALRISERGDG